MILIIKLTIQTKNRRTHNKCQGINKHTKQCSYNAKTFDKVFLLSLPVFITLKVKTVENTYVRTHLYENNLFYVQAQLTTQTGHCIVICLYPKPCR